MPVDRHSERRPEPQRPGRDRAAISFTVDATGILRTTLRGTVSVLDCLRHMEAREAAGLLAVPQIIDARDARLDVSVDDIRRIAVLAKVIRRRSNVGPTAFVASEDLTYGIGRMYEGFDPHGPRGFAVFRSVREAEAWLAAAD